MPAIFQPRTAKKINKAPSVRVIVICSDHRLLWRDSYKGVDRTLTSDESILHKIIIIRFLNEILIGKYLPRREIVRVIKSLAILLGLGSFAQCKFFAQYQFASLGWGMGGYGGLVCSVTLG